jgi:hypothetical protein
MGGPILKARKEDASACSEFFDDNILFCDEFLDESLAHAEPGRGIVDRDPARDLVRLDRCDLD